MTDDRRQRGTQLLEQIFGSVPAVPAAVQPLMDVTIEHLFGDIWLRPGLALADRSMVTVAVLAALGREQQLKLHLRGALNLGNPPEKLQEVLVQVAHYAGWPTGMAGLAALQEVLAQREAG